MNTHLKSVLLKMSIVAFFASSWTFQAMGKQLTDKEIASRIDKSFEYHSSRLNVPGALLGIVIGDSFTYKNAYGTKSVTDSSQLTEKTIFQVGSIAKSIHTVLAMRILNKYRIHLDNEIKAYIPKLCKKNLCDSITFRQLLSHTSQLSSAGGLHLIKTQKSAESSVSSILFNKRKKSGRFYPFQYNNIAFEIVRLTLEEISGKNYNTLLEETLFRRTAMKGSSIGFEAFQKSKNKFTPHLFQKGRFSPTKPSKYFYNYPGCCVVNTNLEDMMWFLSLELGYKANVINKSLLELTHKPVAPAVDFIHLNGQQYGGGAVKSLYGLGHRILDYPDLKVVFHPSWIHGTKSIYAIFPDQKIGFVVLQNSPSLLGFRVLEDTILYLRGKR